MNQYLTRRLRNNKYKVIIILSSVNKQVAQSDSSCYESHKVICKFNMVNASLNWASILGILLVIWGLIAAPASLAQINYLIRHKPNRKKIDYIKVAFRLAIGVGRLFGSLLVGGIFFFQGWRLDPILQLGVFLLTFGVILESASGVLSDRKSYLLRKAGSKSIN